MLRKNYIGLVLLLFVFCLNSAIAAKLANGEYALTNGNFEDANSITGWSQWPVNDPLSYAAISNDSAKAYYGSKSVAMYRDTNSIILYQDVAIVDIASDGPHTGETPEVGVWVMFDANSVKGSCQVVLEVKSIVGGVPSTIAISPAINSKEAGKWYYLLTDSNTASVVPSEATAIQVAVTSHADGVVYLDFAQTGLANSITGNPSKLAIVEYHTWFDVPDYLPDPRRFTEVGYTGFSSYDQHAWEHWEWGWDPDRGYNNDPGFYKQIGICDGREFVATNDGFEDDNFSGGGEYDWRRYPDPCDPCFVYDPNITTLVTTAQAHSGNKSVAFNNGYHGSQACSVWRWYACKNILNQENDYANEKERIQASAWIKFDDVNDVNFAGGNFWIQVDARHDPDFNENTDNDVWTTLAESYEHISPEYVRENMDANGWVQIKTRPLNKAVIPWWTKGLEVSIQHYYNGIVYIDDVELGEAEYSNVQRQTACDKYPIIGPYKSTDANVIDYHLDLCQAMLIDAVLVNYYGHQFSQESYQTDAFATMAQKVDDRDMKICVFYEPKIHLKQWADPNYKILDINELDSNAVALINDYIDDVTSYNTINDIVDANNVIDIGKIIFYYKMANIQEDIKYVLDNWGSEKCYLTHRGRPVIGIFGLYSAEAEDDMNNANWQEIIDNLTVYDGDYDFIFIGDTVIGTTDWFDAFSGMFNWFLVDDIVRDRCDPNEQDVYERSRDIVNGRTVDWTAGDAERFPIGITYPRFSDESVSAWGPVNILDANGNYILDEFGEPILREYVNRTPSWNGDFYRKNNQGLMYHANDIDWFLIATFNDWNEGSSIEPSAENKYLFPIITQDLIEDFKGIANQPNDLMQEVTEGYVNKAVVMDVDTTIKKTYFQLIAYQYDSNGVYLGDENVLTLIDWTHDTGTFTSQFANHHQDLAEYVPAIRISTNVNTGWIEIDQISEGSWVEDFSSDSNWTAFEGATISANNSIAKIGDSNDGTGGAVFNGTRVSYSSGDIISITVNELYGDRTAAASMKMVLTYEGFNEYNLDTLHEYALTQNVDSGMTIGVDPTALYKTLNHFEIDSDYNFGASYSSTNINSVYSSICYWMAYDVLNVSPRPEKMPAMIPLNGDYKNWVIVNGYKASGNPRTATTYDVIGFWIIDPNVNGLGQKQYITAEDLKSDFIVIDSNDTYNGKYVAVCEPPKTAAKVTVAKPKPAKNFKRSKKGIIKAAIEGVNKNDLKDNRSFGKALNNAKPVEPILVMADSSYYLVPFVKDGGCSAIIKLDAKTGAFLRMTYCDEPNKDYMNTYLGSKTIRFSKREKRKSCQYYPDKGTIERIR